MTQHLLLLLIAFLLPIQIKYVSGVIVLFSVVSVISWMIERRSNKNIFHFFSWVLIGFYLLNLLGLIYSQDSKEGLFDLEIKLSFLVFPVVLTLMYEKNKQKTGQLFAVFIGGTIVATIICLLQSLLKYSNSPEMKWFYGKEYVFHMHLGYFAAYINLAFVFIYYFFRNQKNLKIRLLLIITSFILLLSLVLTSSKNGAITTAIIAVLLIAHYVFINRKYFAGLIAFAVLSLSLLIMLWAFPMMTKRFEVAINSFSKDSTPTEELRESTQARVLVWTIAVEKIKEKPIFGHGTGSVNKVLLEEYEKRDWKMGIERNINTHNQFLQTGISQGVIGIVVLIFMLFSGIYLGWSNRNLELILFSSIIIIFALTESIFEVQAGTIFFGLFATFLVLQPVKKSHTLDS